jgi:thiamine-phosphate pyrophosphorylase
VIASVADAQLYGIVDLGYVASADAPRVTSEMIQGGVQVVQLRAKKQRAEEITRLAKELHRTTAAAGVPLVINDHPAVARHAGAEGVHVGQDDISIAEARELAGGRCFVGRSTHSVEQAIRAAEEGPDYIGFGPLFATATKPDYVPIGLGDIARVHALVQVPIFCIGGIKLDNLAQVIAAGARRVVIVSGLLQASDIAAYARQVRAILAAR